MVHLGTYFMKIFKCVFYDDGFSDGVFFDFSLLCRTVNLFYVYVVRVALVCCAAVSLVLCILSSHSIVLFPIASNNYTTGSIAI